MTLVCNILSTPVKCLSTFFSVSACMTGCTGFKWLGKHSDTKCPTPFPNYSPIWKCVYGFLHRLHALQPTTPRLPNSVADVDLFCVDVFVFSWSIFFYRLHLKYLSLFLSVVLSKLFWLSTCSGEICGFRIHGQNVPFDAVVLDKSTGEGVIRAKDKLDCELQKEHTFTIQAYDCGEGPDGANMKKSHK